MTASIDQDVGLLHQTTSYERLGFIGDGILDFRESFFYQLQAFV